MNVLTRRLKDNIVYDTDILNMSSGCWKFNCSDTKGLYLPLITETRKFNLGNYKVEAVRETNLFPYLAGALILYLIMK